MCTFRRAKSQCGCTDRYWIWCQPLSERNSQFKKEKVYPRRDGIPGLWEPAPSLLEGSGCGNRDTRATHQSSRTDVFSHCCSLVCCAKEIKQLKRKCRNLERQCQLPAGKLTSAPGSEIALAELPDDIANRYSRECKAHATTCNERIFEGESFTNLARIKNGLPRVGEYGGTVQGTVRSRQEIRQRLQLHHYFPPPFPDG